jgi:hypothetical protein
VEKSVNWQPIETAPQDGTWFLAWWSGSQIMEPVYFGEYWEDGDDNPLVGWCDSEGDHAPGPDYWYPLPEPPKRKPEEKSGPSYSKYQITWEE